MKLEDKLLLLVEELGVDAEYYLQTSHIGTLLNGMEGLVDDFFDDKFKAIFEALQNRLYELRHELANKEITSSGNKPYANKKGDE